jgi:hypothetical protein
MMVPPPLDWGPAELAVDDAAPDALDSANTADAISSSLKATYVVFSTLEKFLRVRFWQDL